MFSLLSASQFASRDALEEFFRSVDTDESSPKVSSGLVTTVFFEPSTRTRMSFGAAAQRVGAGWTDLGDVRRTSLAKGESEEHTVRTLGQYAEVLVLRHATEGKVAHLASHAGVHVVNGGDGDGEHPTQALLDLYTVLKCKQRIGGLRYVLCGDLRHSRTIRSLLILMSLFRGKERPSLVAVGPDEAMLRKNQVPRGLSVEREPTLSGALRRGADVLYCTRPQVERHASPIGFHERHMLAGSMKCLPKDVIVMHPGPIVTEIHPSFDDDPRAMYFMQANLGLLVRMAIVRQLLTNGGIAGAVAS